jgi:hypothetical protein
MDRLLEEVSKLQTLAKEIANQMGNISDEFENSLTNEKRIAQEEICRLKESTTAAAKELQIKIDTMKEKVEPFQEVVTLNVGGTNFVTSLATISSPRSKVLNAMFSGDVPAPLKINGAYFLDRNPLIFALVLDFLRGCDVAARFEDKSQLLSLYDEANFFEITELVDQIEMKLHLKIPTAEGNPPSPLRRIAHPIECSTSRTLTSILLSTKSSRLQELRTSGQCELLLSQLHWM